MKISPVLGTPNISQTPSTGLSIDKLQKIKTIAEKGIIPHEEKTSIDQKVPPSSQTIKMQTNKSSELINAPQESSGEKPGGGPIPIAPEAEIKHENDISDADVQTKPKPEDTQQVSPQLAALAKQKRALQVKERELAEREKALESKNQSRAELEQRVKSGQALSVLQDLGITYDQLTNELLGKQTSPDLSSVKEEILKSVEERLANKETAQEEAVLSQIQRNVTKLITTEKYPFVKTEGAQDKVLELIKRTWKEEGEVLDEEDALEAIEAELKEKAKNFAKLLGLGQTPTAPVELPKQAVSNSIKTLTNKDSARPQSNRRQRALAAFLGQK